MLKENQTNEINQTDIPSSKNILMTSPYASQVITNLTNEIKAYRFLTDQLNEQLEASLILSGVLSELRSEVIIFAQMMERQLKANDHKTGWKNDAPFDLMERLWEEANELNNTPFVLADKIGKESADVANFAMMVADVCGGLK